MVSRYGYCKQPTNEVYAALSKAVQPQAPAQRIVPQHILDWQIELVAGRERLETAWQHLQIKEVGLLRALEQEREVSEHDQLFSCLDQVRQRMTEIELEIRYGPDWAFNGHGGEHGE